MENHDSFMARVAWMSEANQMRIEWAYTSAKYYPLMDRLVELAGDEPFKLQCAKWIRQAIRSTAEDLDAPKVM